jgi:NAD(P)H-hydrate epimerase
MIRLTREQVREIDRRSIEEYHIPGIVLMENAARGVADVAMEMLTNIAEPLAWIICGGGNNGGDGLAVARHLHNLGVNVLIWQAWHGQLKGDAAMNLSVAEAMELSIAPIDYLEGAVERPPELIIDALFGTGLTRPIEGELMEVVEIYMQTEARLPVLAIDVPSGLDCDTGEPLGACVRAARTVTFVAEKAGFANPRSKDFTGEITVADIGCPRELIDEVARPSA